MSAMDGTGIDMRMMIAAVMYGEGLTNFTGKNCFNRRHAIRIMIAHGEQSQHTQNEQMITVHRHVQRFR
jgi:hypothetical protein